MPRDNIDTLSRAARRAAASTLATLCIVRDADYAGGDAVERAIMAMVAPDIDTAAAAASADGGDSSATADGTKVAVSGNVGYDIATASEWPGGVAKQDVLIAPAEARSAWREFMSASTLAVQQVRATPGQLRVRVAVAHQQSVYSLTA